MAHFISHWGELSASGEIGLLGCCSLSWLFAFTGESFPVGRRVPGEEAFRVSAPAREHVPRIQAVDVCDICVLAAR